MNVDPPHDIIDSTAPEFVEGLGGKVEKPRRRVFIELFADEAPRLRRATVEEKARWVNDALERLSPTGRGDQT